MEQKKSVKDLVNEKVIRHDVSRVQRRALTCSCKFTAFTQLHPLHIGRGKSSVSPLQVERVRERVYDSGIPQSLLKVKGLFALKRTAFTLAEVLITLAVIGIVAVMTIPNLVQSYKKKVVETKLAKFYSMINQAVKLSEIDNGPMADWDYNLDTIYDEEGNPIADGKRTGGKFDKYLAPYIKIVSIDEAEQTPSQIIDKAVAYNLPDGSSILISKFQNREILYTTEFPKKCFAKKQFMGTCAFCFAFIPNRYLSDYKYNISNGVQPMLYMWDGNEESLYDNQTYGCNTTGTAQKGYYCTEVIRRNGWKIPEDYPYKF